MADTKISALAAASTPVGTELLAIVQTTTKRTTIDDLFKHSINLTGALTVSGLVTMNGGGEVKGAGNQTFEVECTDANDAILSLRDAAGYTQILTNGGGNMVFRNRHTDGDLSFYYTDTGPALRLFMNLDAGADTLTLGTIGVTALTIDASQNTALAGTLAVNGAALTSDDATFALLNVTPATINAFGGASMVRSDGSNAAARQLIWSNDSAAASADCLMGVSNIDGSLTGGLALVSFGTGWADGTNPAFVQDGTCLLAGNAANGGMTICTQQAAGDLRFYVGGSTATEYAALIAAADLKASFFADMQLGTDNSFDVDLKSHLKSTQATAPTSTINAAIIGASGTIVLTAGSTDVAGSFVITTDSGAGTAGLAGTIDFDEAFGSAPSCVILTPGDQEQEVYSVGTVTTAGFQVYFDSIPDTDDTHKVFYFVVE